MKIVHASVSENNTAGWDGKAKAGDQTGREVCVVPWYSSPWDIVLRYPDKNISTKAQDAARALAASNLVGYDQSERNSLYKALKACNYDVAKYIKTGEKTECDCSSFVYAVYACFIPRMRNDYNAPVTSTMRTMYTQWGFSVFTDSEYLNGQNLIDGDILVNELSHTAIAFNDVVEIPKTLGVVDTAIDTIARDVIKGHWGNGSERKERLYAAIQNRVNELWKMGVRGD